MAANPFKSILEQFGVKSEANAAPAPAPPLDPDALAELEGGTILDRRREQHLSQAMTQTQGAITSGQSPVDIDGNVDFGLLYTQAGVPSAGFTAEQALEAIHNVEANIPPVISAPTQRSAMIRGMLLAVVKGPAGPEKIALDAHNKQNALDQFLEARTDLLVTLQQKADEAIRDLEAQIEARKKAREAAEKQYEKMRKNCQQQRDSYDRVIDLFSTPE